MKFAPLFILLFLLVNCDSATKTENTSTTATTSTTNLGAYELSPIAGTGLQYAERHDETGRLVEVGSFRNGLREGTWTQYGEKGYVPVKIETYKNDQLHGAYLEIDPMGRVTKTANYKLNELHGPYAEYRASLPQLTANYKEGKLHGTLRQHTLQNGKVNQTVEYVNGVQEGPMRWFNAAEEMIQERMYRNGEVVEGN